MIKSTTTSRRLTRKSESFTFAGLAIACLSAGAGACVSNESATPSSDIASEQTALTALEGTFEFAIDAPWRMEPEKNGSTYNYGPIPIVMEVFDMDTIHFDDNRDALGHVTSLQITAYVAGDQRGDSTVTWESFTDLEYTDGYWKLGAQPAPYRYQCQPEQGDCSFRSRTPQNTSEWRALYWYSPPASAATPGTDLVLRFRLRFDDDTKLENWARVHYGEEPLPRFGSWMYGDLHYHSQGTDNEGESGYGYTGVIRALGAIGVDFVFATEHASDAAQLVDTDLDVEHDFDADLCATKRGLRDMSRQRWDYSIATLLGGPTGATQKIAADIAAGRAPMLLRSQGREPRIFLGGEVDFAPEVEFRPNSLNFDENNPTWKLFYADGQELFYGDEGELCEGWEDSWINFQNCDGPSDDRPCPTAWGDWFHFNGESFFVSDHQGVHESNFFTRQHALYLPREARAGAFVASKTSVYGGATRRLVGEWFGSELPGVADEIEEKGGYLFLAHPFGHGGGAQGPGMLPLTDYLLKRAFANRAVLGLEFWNENDRFRNRNPYETGYRHQAHSEFPTAHGDTFEFFPMCSEVCFDVEVNGVTMKNCVLDPNCDEKMRNWRWSEAVDPIDQLRLDARGWDMMLRWGVDPEKTADLAWLKPNEPRRIFMAGGSDAHGDLSYRRAGYMVKTTTASDTAIAIVRNLVDVVSAGPAPRQEDVVDALVAGRFSVTDGPALRIAIDMNHNGIIDEGDARMGDVISRFAREMTVLVEWETTTEFGYITELTLFLGDRAQTWEVAPSGSLTGKKKTLAIPLDLTNYSFDAMFYLRAFAAVQRHSCNDPGDELNERCVTRYAFTNPVWVRPDVELFVAAVL